MTPDWDAFERRHYRKVGRILLGMLSGYDDAASEEEWESLTDAERRVFLREAERLSRKYSREIEQEILYGVPGAKPPRGIIRATE